MSERVLVVTTSYPASEDDAAGHFVRAEADAIMRAGARVVVVSPGAPGRSGDDSLLVVRIAAGGCSGAPGMLWRLRQRPHRVAGLARFVVGARRAIRDLGTFDRVVAHWLVPSGWPVATRASARLEVVAHGSDVRLLEASGAAPYVGRLLVARGATFRFVSEELRERFARASGLSMDAAVVRPCLVDTSGVPPRASARRACAVGDADVLAVVVGRLVKSKRVDQAVELARARATRVVVVGDGPERAALEARFPEVRFAGALPRPRALAWISAADLLVSASRDEGAPTAIREARALGTAVLSAPAGDVERWAALDPGIEIVG